jgi:hypothetical protein
MPICRICSGDGYQTAIILRQPVIGFRYRMPVVLSRQNFAINWLKIRDFGRRKPVFASVVLKIGLRRVIRIYNVVIRTGAGLLVVCGKHIDGWGMGSEDGFSDI